MGASPLPAQLSHRSGSPDTSEPRPEPERGERCRCAESADFRGSIAAGRSSASGPAAHLPSEREMTARAKANSARARRSMLGRLEDAGRRCSARPGGRGALLAAPPPLPL